MAKALLSGFSGSNRFAQCLKARLQWPPAGVDHQVGFAIEGLARCQDALKVFHRFAIVGHGTHVALGHDALHMVLRSSAQPDGVTHGEQALKSCGLRHQASPGCQHEARVALDDFVEATTFQPTEAALSIEVEDHAEGNTALVLNQAVELEERYFE